MTSLVILAHLLRLWVRLGPSDRAALLAVAERLAETPDEPLNDR